MIGHDLTRAEEQQAPGRAIMQFNGTQAYMFGDHVAVLQKDLPVQQYIYKDGHLSELDTYDPKLERMALAHAAWSSMAYEKSLYRLSAHEPVGHGTYSD